MSTEWTVAIIGCGDVAGGYDQRKNGEGVFSHAGSYKSVPGFRLAAAFDPNTDRADEFCQYWGVEKNCQSLDELLQGRYDAVSVCSPDQTHEALLEQVLDAACARYIWAEKPLTTDAKSARRIVARAREMGVGLLLSNQRRWEPVHGAIQGRIASGEFGRLIHATAYYVKGAVHIGCTAVDTIRFLLGEAAWVAAFPPYEVGSYAGDPSHRGIMGMDGGGTAALIGCDPEDYHYSIFELDALFTRGRVRIEENGEKVLIYKVRGDPHHNGFGDLTLAEDLKTEMIWAMGRGAGLIRDDLTAGKCAVALALEGVLDLDVVDALKRSARDGGVKIEL